MGVTMQLVDNILKYYNEVPDTVLETTKTLVLDAYGVVIAGTKTNEGRIALEMATQMGGHGSATLVGAARAQDPVSAALANGIMGYSLGLTDTHSLSITHPGCSIVPASIAVAEHEGKLGKELLKAITMGYEVVTRLGRAINPSHRARGFHTSATCNPFGTAISCALLLGCNREQLAWALGIAGSTSSGLFEFRKNGDMTMAFHGGWPAHSGVIAAYMAKKGFTGPKTIFEGQDGFLKAMADKYDAELINKDFGQSFAVDDMSLRAYCACRYAHTAIEALEVIKRRKTVDADKVAEIIVQTHKTAIVQETAPDTLTGARLCAGFALAQAIQYGPKLTEVEPEELKDEKILGLYKKVKMLEDTEMTAKFPTLWTSRLQLKYTDGSVDEQLVHYAKGDPLNQMTPAEVIYKFKSITSNALSASKADEFIASVANLENISVQELMKPLR